MVASGVMETKSAETWAVLSDFGTTLSPVPRAVRCNAAGTIEMTGADGTSSGSLNVVTGEVLAMRPRTIVDGGTSLAVSDIFDFSGTEMPPELRATFVRTGPATMWLDDGTLGWGPCNLCLQSQTFGVTWTPLRCSVGSNSHTAPDGTVTADSLSQTAGQTTAGAVTQAPLFTNGLRYTVSVYAKAGSKTFLTIGEAATSIGVTYARTYFDLSTGVVGTVGPGSTATITSEGDGWYLCAISFVSAGTGTYLIALEASDTDGSRVVVDSGGIALWGCVICHGSAAFDYIRYGLVTTTAAVYLPRLELSSHYDRRRLPPPPRTLPVHGEAAVSGGGGADEPAALLAGESGELDIDERNIHGWRCDGAGWDGKRRQGRGHGQRGDESLQSVRDSYCWDGGDHDHRRQAGVGCNRRERLPVPKRDDLD